MMDNKAYIEEFCQGHRGGMTTEEYLLIYETIVSKAPCNLLIFGAGHDMKLWSKSNNGGIIDVLEDIPKWINMIKKQFPNATFHFVEYGTSIKKASSLLKKHKAGENVFHMKLPARVKEIPWDIILVDGPMGWGKRCPGRMKSIYMASRLRGKECDIFVHDCHRKIEKVFCKKFLGSATKRVGKLHQFKET